jgi:hypothetical protein
MKNMVGCLRHLLYYKIILQLTVILVVSLYIMMNRNIGRWFTIFKPLIIINFGAMEKINNRQNFSTHIVNNKSL